MHLFLPSLGSVLEPDIAKVYVYNSTDLTRRRLLTGEAQSHVLKVNVLLVGFAIFRTGIVEKQGEMLRGSVGDSSRKFDERNIYEELWLRETVGRLHRVGSIGVFGDRLWYDGSSISHPHLFGAEFLHYGGLIADFLLLFIHSPSRCCAGSRICRPFLLASLPWKPVTNSCSHRMVIRKSLPSRVIRDS